MLIYPDKFVGETVNFLVDTSSRKATKYVSDKLVINATRRTYQGKILKGNIEVVLKIGKPNYQERQFIKLLKKSKEPFPVKNIVTKPLVNKRKKP
jgi:hypothetical protein